MRRRQTLFDALRAWLRRPWAALPLLQAPIMFNPTDATTVTNQTNPVPASGVAFGANRLVTVSQFNFPNNAFDALATTISASSQDGTFGGRMRKVLGAESAAS